MIEFNEQLIRKFLNNMVEHHVECHSFTIIQNGKTICSNSYYPFQNDCLHPVFSVSKSFTSIAAGILSEEGKIDLKQNWLSYFPEYRNIAADGFSNVTIRDLLTMQMGQDEEPYLNSQDDWIANIVSKPLVYQPGTHFFYSSMCTHLISALVQRITSKSLAEFLDEALMKPLGIHDYYWDSDQHGITAGGFGLHISTSDLATFGQLLLERGTYKGKQLIPAHWIDEAVRSQVDTSSYYPVERTENRQGYGYFFWRCSHHAFRCSGLHGQLCFVQPENNLVIAMSSATSGSQAILDCLYSAMYENAGSTNPVHFQLPILSGNSKSNYFIEHMLRLKALNNPALITEIKLVQDDNQLSVAFKKNKKNYSFIAGYQVWQQSQDNFTNFTETEWHCAMNDSVPEQYQYPVFANYSWKTPTTLEIQVRSQNNSAAYHFVFLLDRNYLILRYHADAVYSYFSSFEVVFPFSSAKSDISKSR